MTPIRLLALLLLACAGFASDISGTWIGRFTYAQGADTTVFFSMVVRQDGKIVSGRLIEPNTFGQATADHLSSDIVGQCDGEAVTLYKKYDGAGGQHHVVVYSGKLTPGTITGTWELSSGAKGPFTMKLVTNALFEKPEKDSVKF